MSDPTHVYVWRNPYNKVMGVSLKPIEYLGGSEKGTETFAILTPAHAAVIAAAQAVGPTFPFVPKNLASDLTNAILALRSQENGNV